MEDRIRTLIADHARRKVGTEPASLSLRADDPWDIHITFGLSADDRFEIRNVSGDDLATFQAFGARLSPASKNFFLPYPWDHPDRLTSALRAAMDQAVSRVDVCYFMCHNGAPAGQFFLWKAGGNPDSRAYGLEIPELGVGFADAYHGRGLGSFSVRLLNIVAEHLRADAVELTTAMENEPGFRAYLAAGYEYVGDIANPVEVDVTAVLSGLVKPSWWRTERQMIYLINRGRRGEVLAYLAAKRDRMAALV